MNSPAPVKQPSAREPAPKALEPPPAPDHSTAPANPPPAANGVVALLAILAARDPN